jgi:flagellar hook assembly protein FlgD
MTLDASGNVYICGTMTSSGSNHDLFVIRYSQNLSPLIQVSETATEFSLQQNYPNPFNPSTKIKFTVPASQGDKQVKLSVYNAVGSLVRVLVEGQLNAGEYETDFNAEGLSSGIYFCRMETGNFSGVRKMILVR